VGQLLGITSVVGVLGFFKSAADEAIRGEEAMRRLQFAVDSTGGSFEKSKDHITAFADQQQSLTQFSQTQTYEAMTRLVRITGDVGQAMQATRLVFGMASASGKDFNSIMDLLSPILQGDATRLRGLQSEFGAFIGPASTAQEVLDALSKKFLGVAEHQTGFAVEIQKSKNSLSEFQEKVGQGVLPAFSVLLKAGEAVAKFFEELAVGFAMDAAKIVEVFKFLFGSLQDFSLDGLKSRFNEFTNNWVSINQAAGQQIAEIEKRYSKERIDIQQDEERIKAGLRHKSLEEIKAEQEERRKLEAESSQLINKLEADLATQQKKDFESRMDYSNAEKKRPRRPPEVN
jgi:dimeric dUTPase (all-alpha-NTP-PPase superfamily)